MFYRTDDPERDYLRYDAECQRELDRLPVCYECDHPIQDDECFEFDGELICPNCLTENHRKWVEDYIK